MTETPPGSADVLIFVEQAGAANFVAGLPVALARFGWTTRVFAKHQGYERLRLHGTCVERLEEHLRLDSMIETVQPRLLLTGISDEPDTPVAGLVENAGVKGVVTVGIVDSRVSLRNRLRGCGSASVSTQIWLMVPDEWTRRALGDLGYPPGKIVVTGNPHFDSVRQTAATLAEKDRAALRASLYPGAAVDQRIVLFAAEPATKPHQDLAGLRLAFSGRGQSDRPSYIAIEEFLDSLKACAARPFSVLRLHPKSRAEDFSAYLAEFDQVSAGGDPLPMAYAADLIIGSTSMLLIEAAVMGCRTLSLVLDPDEAEWLTLDMGITAFAHSREELRSCLPKLLNLYDDATGSMTRAHTPGISERLAEALDRLITGKHSMDGPGR